MRTRKLFAGALLALMSVVFIGGIASAQEGSNLPKGSDDATTECIKKIADKSVGGEGGTIDDCQKAPSPILPQPNEIIWSVISFAVLFFLLWKFAYPGLKKGVADRSERIRTDLDAAEQAKADAEGVLVQYRAQLADAKSEAARIIEEARQQADAIKREQEQRLQGELAEMRSRAAADVEAAKAQAMADLRGEVAQLAVGAAEVVIERNLDAATQQQLIDNYINSLASRAN
jgi:F-type H+-transporting ATPase subunit b